MYPEIACNFPVPVPRSHLLRLEHFRYGINVAIGEIHHVKDLVFILSWPTKLWYFKVRYLDTISRVLTDDNKRAWSVVPPPGEMRSAASASSHAHRKPFRKHVCI